MTILWDLTFQQSLSCRSPLQYNNCRVLTKHWIYKTYVSIFNTNWHTYSGSPNYPNTDSRNFDWPMSGVDNIDITLLPVFVFIKQRWDKLYLFCDTKRWWVHFSTLSDSNERFSNNEKVSTEDLHWKRTTTYNLSKKWTNALCQPAGRHKDVFIRRRPSLVMSSCLR